MKKPTDKENTSAGEPHPPTNQNSTADSPSTEYPRGLKLFTISIGLFLAVLCVGLDRSIIATAIPKITSEFNSLPDVGWYGSAYLLTSAAFQLMFGKMYAEFNQKGIFLISLSLFEIGSIVCAVASNSPVLIVGRAIAGLGSAGVGTGALSLIGILVPVQNRPKFVGAVGSAVGISQVFGPTLGGVFTDYLNWRWCFWINLPLGAVTVASVFFFLNVPAPPNATGGRLSPLQLLEKFDTLGTLFILPSVVSLLLALQWGGIQYPWSSWRIILLLTVFAVCFVTWVAVQVAEGDKATVPLRIIRQRSIFCAIWFMFCVMGVVFVLSYFNPIWFQAVLDVTAHQSGINTLASTVSMTIMAIAAGQVTSRIGYPNPLMITGSVLLSVAAGMIYRFDVDTSTGYWLGSLIVLGIGSGSGLQQSLMIPHSVLKGGDIALGTSAIMFVQTLSGTIFLSVAESLLHGRLLAELSERVPQVDPSVVVSSGASQLAESMSKLYPPTTVHDILISYNEALRGVYLIPVVLAPLSVLGSALCDWNSVKRRQVDTKILVDAEASSTIRLDEATSMKTGEAVVKSANQT